ncbi:MarR family transcriptional regulator [Halobacteriales archaeon QS_4_62_28]|nr:MAG: MarR family transcriptional regulator [Halobacteriales archaeon QS_4_62_28]
MRAKPEHRDRPDTEVAVLDALADRPEDGMTIFELRSHVDADIDHLEDALSSLKTDTLIEVSSNGDRTVLTPEEHAVGQYDPGDEESVLDAIKRRFF